ncbi:MAG: hypothetical protein QM790_17150 [Nibricoccus sp.]
MKAQTSTAAPLALTPAIVKSLEQRWAALQPDGKRNISTRDFFSYFLELAARGGDMSRAERILELARQKREPDASSKLFGNYAWYWKDAHPDDRNAVEFCMQAGSLAWTLFREKLSPKAHELLEAEMRYAIIGIRAHKVPLSYTNIFLMKAANCIFIGENLSDEPLAQEGYAMFEQWFEYTRENGTHEYSSPTYYGVDLGSLGLLVKYSKNQHVRAEAEKALRFFWTEIAANWFEPFKGVAGAHSRDYDFLCGHGLLDRYLEKAGWFAPDKPSSPDALIELSAWAPPSDLRGAVSVAPHIVFQRWGEKPWESATHYVGTHFTLGSAGSGYGQQDKILTVNLPFDAHTPIVNFSMDERGDPYGQAKVLTSGGHMKLTHLVPFLTSVQHGPEVLLLACQNPQKKSSPSANSVVSNLVFPSAAEVWLAEGPLKFKDGEMRHELSAGTTIFLRAGDVAVAMRYLLALNAAGQPAPIAVVRDGGKVPAARFSAFHSEMPISGRAVVAVWIRVAEGLDEGAFDRFRKECAAVRTQQSVVGEIAKVAVPGARGELRLAVDLKAEKRLEREGSSVENERSILSVNGIDFGTELLR